MFFFYFFMWTRNRICGRGNAASLRILMRLSFLFGFVFCDYFLFFYEVMEQDIGRGNAASLRI